MYIFRVLNPPQWCWTQRSAVPLFVFFVSEMGTGLKILHKISIAELIILKSFTIRNLQPVYEGTTFFEHMQFLARPQPDTKLEAQVSLYRSPE